MGSVERLLSLIPKKVKIDLVDYLIAPAITINALNEYGWLEAFKWMDPNHPDFNFEKTILRTKLYAEDIKFLESDFHAYLEQNKVVPQKMISLIEKMKTDTVIDVDSKARFLSSLVFSAVESTVSFVSSFAFIINTQYKELLTDIEDNKDTLTRIANEVIRIYAPVPYIFRTVRNKTNYAGVNLNVGDTVLLYLCSANLDSLAFQSPEEIDLNRAEKHLSFGAGPYACIGRYASINSGMNFLKSLVDLGFDASFESKELNHFLKFGILKCKLEVVLN
jgi:hypothetical protein